MRPSPRISPEEITARVILEPSGAHRLEVAIPSGIVAMNFNAGQVPQLKQAIAEFEALAARADGGPDFYNRRTIAVGAGR